MLICVLIFATLFINNNASNDSEKSMLLDKDNPNTLEQIAQFGIMATFSKMIDKTYNLMRRQTHYTPTKEECQVSKINIGYVTYYYSKHPRGKCLYCCPVINAKNYINLFWTTKSKNGNLSRLSWNLKEGNLRNQGFNSHFPTVIFIHGFTQAGDDYHSSEIRNAYLSRKEEYNQIFVSWCELSAFPWYINSVNNTKIVAEQVAHFLKFYIKTGEIDLTTLHLIGFSLGSHVVGMIGKKIKNIPRITGLDPAMPLYYLNDTSNRLCNTDAHYVDVIHSDPGRFGFHVSVGNADFYPNLKSIDYDQPGCTFKELSEFSTVELFVVCNHYRAVDFYSESVRNPKAFPATSCNFNSNDLAAGNVCRFNVEAYMGFSANINTTNGDYYLITNSRTPYGRSMSQQRTAIRLQNKRRKFARIKNF